MTRNRTLWAIQWLLAALFLFAGSMKLVVPIGPMSAMTGLPGPFLRFIGVAEVTGAVGLVLPWLLRIRAILTPVAAGGLVVIMMGAVVVTVIGGSVGGALVPAIVGLALATVAYGRSRTIEREIAIA